MRRDTRCERQTRAGSPCGAPKHLDLGTCWNHLSSHQQRRLRQDGKSPHQLKAQAEERQRRLRDEFSAVRLRELEAISLERDMANRCGHASDPAEPPCLEPKVPGSSRCAQHEKLRRLRQRFDELDSMVCARRRCRAERIEGSLFCWRHSGEPWRRKAQQQARQRNEERQRSRTAEEPTGRPTRRLPRAARKGQQQDQQRRRLDPETVARLHRRWENRLRQARLDRQERAHPKGVATEVTPRRASMRTGSSDGPKPTLRGGATTGQRLAQGRDVGRGDTSS